MERKTNKKVPENKDSKKFKAISTVHLNMKGDEKNIALLFFLYTLQGIPLGLSAALPMILQNRGITYKQQVGSINTTILSSFENRKSKNRDELLHHMFHYIVLSYLKQS